MVSVERAFNSGAMNPETGWDAVRQRRWILAYVWRGSIGNCVLRSRYYRNERAWSRAKLMTSISELDVHRRRCDGCAFTHRTALRCEVRSTELRPW